MNRLGPGVNLWVATESPLSVGSVEHLRRGHSATDGGRARRSFIRAVAITVLTVNHKRVWRSSSSDLPSDRNLGDAVPPSTYTSGANCIAIAIVDNFGAGVGSAPLCFADVQRRRCLRMPRSSYCGVTLTQRTRSKCAVLPEALAVSGGMTTLASTVASCLIDSLGWASDLLVNDYRGAKMSSGTRTSQFSHLIPD